MGCCIFMQTLGQNCFQKEYQHNFFEQYTRQNRNYLSQRTLLMFIKASCLRKRPPGFICSTQTSLAATCRKSFASYFTVCTCFFPRRTSHFLPSEEGGVVPSGVTGVAGIGLAGVVISPISGWL